MHHFHHVEVCSLVMYTDTVVWPAYRTSSKLKLSSLKQLPDPPPPASAATAPSMISVALSTSWKWDCAVFVLL